MTYRKPVIVKAQPLAKITAVKAVSGKIVR